MALVGALDPEDKMDERYYEYEERLIEGVDEPKLIVEAEEEAADAIQEIAKDEAEAITTPALEDDLRVLARHKALEERYRLHLQRMKNLQERIPQAQGLAVAIQKQTENTNRYEAATEAMRTRMETRLQTRVQTRTENGQVIVEFPDKPEIAPVVGPELETKVICSIPKEVYDQVRSQSQITSETAEKVMNEGYVSAQMLDYVPPMVLAKAVQQGEVPTDILQQLGTQNANKIAFACGVPNDIVQGLQGGQIQVQQGIKVQMKTQTNTGMMAQKGR